MAAMKYLPRSGYEIKGKPKVYFCAHPQDHGTYLEPIYQDLWDVTNCSVWYLEDPNETRDEEFWADLGQMQLVVMAVTSRLLSTENPAMEEFRFAVERHIPVLPLMQEQGLEALFDETCGDLHFLDKNDPDDTAISYDEKLRKFLSVIFIGYELEERVRAAFDAYVFLSYRKKDRRYAQELMELIHRNDFARDIAIWYDEFLTPGENFNDAILNALKKSDLFVLAVTPNLVNEDNYIRQHEFPIARDGGKPILPVELLSTDRDALEAQYEGIPACTDSHNDAAFSEALLKNLRQLALRENDNDPVHNYLIGLAYLTGIDVEVSYDRALALITSAADNGLVEAAQRLVEMYETGHGVEYDTEKAYSWKIKAVQLLKQQYEADPGEEKLEELFLEMLVCATWWTDTWRRGDPRRGKPFFQAARDYVEPFAESSPRMQRNLAIAYCAQGEVFRFEEPEALMLFRKGLEIYEDYAKTVNTPESRLELAELSRDMGESCWANADPDRARGYYARGVALAEALAEEPGTVEALEKLFDIAGSWEHFCRSNGEETEAKACWDRVLALTEARASGLEEKKLRELLFSIYRRAGNTYFALREYEEARNLLEKALEIMVWEETDPDRVSFRNRQYMEFGDLFLRAKQFEPAACFFEQGLRFAQKHADVCTNGEEYRSRLVSVYRSAGDWSRAEALCRQRLAEHRAKESEDNVTGYYSRLAMLCEEYGYVLQSMDDLSGAKEQYKQSYLAAEILTLKKGKALIAPDIFRLCHRAADFCVATGDASSARALYRRCLAVVERLYSLDKPAPVVERAPLPQKMTAPPVMPPELQTVPYLQWSELHTRLGDLLFEKGDGKAAQSHYAQALAVWEANGQNRKNRAGLESAALLCKKLAELCEGEKDPAAKDYRAQLAAIDEELAHLPKFAPIWNR